MVGKNSREFKIQTVIQSLFLIAKPLSEKNKTKDSAVSDLKLRSWEIILW